MLCHVMTCHVSALCVPLLQRLCVSGVPKVDQGDTIMTMILINDNDDNDGPGALLELPEQPASHANTSHLMLKWFNSDLVLRNIQVSTSLKFFKSGKISTLLYIDIHKAWRLPLVVPSPC